MFARLPDAAAARGRRHRRRWRAGGRARGRHRRRGAAGRGTSGHCRTTPVTGAPRAPFCMMGVCFDCLVDHRRHRQPAGAAWLRSRRACASSARSGAARDRRRAHDRQLSDASTSPSSAQVPPGLAAATLCRELGLDVALRRTARARRPDLSRHHAQPAAASAPRSSATTIGTARRWCAPLKRQARATCHDATVWSVGAAPTAAFRRCGQSGRTRCAPHARSTRAR